jgi:Uri superfamily endonuclease
VELHTVLENIKSIKCRGYYILLIHNTKEIETIIGYLGRKRLEKGYYLYIGSAQGPGGVGARVNRHLKKKKKIRWHIDYLTTRPTMRIVGIVYTCTTENGAETKIANIIGEKAKPAIPKFGSTDTRDLTHLYKCRDENECLKLASEALRQAIGKEPITIVLSRNH